jgi:predicted DNA-binding protein (MmcQ/YjbR family)
MCSGPYARRMATHEDLEDILSRFPGAGAGFPFGPGARVWKVGGRMFALVDDDSDPPRISLKCDPDLALELRAQYPEQVSGGYHLDKKHWNTVLADDALPRFELEDWVRHSYELVVASLPTRVRDSID